jgi:hypothetical protein
MKQFASLLRIEKSSVVEATATEPAAERTTMRKPKLS